MEKIRCFLNTYSLFVLYLARDLTGSEAFKLTGSSTNATVGLQFILTCETSNGYLVFKMRSSVLCTIYGSNSNGTCQFAGDYSTNYSYACNSSSKTYKVIIPGNLVTEILHNSNWTCGEPFGTGVSQYVLQVNVPVSSVTIASQPMDRNPVNIIQGREHTFRCATNPVRPAARIQWFLSTTNITMSAIPQADSCQNGCSVDKVVSSSVLKYVGNLTDEGKELYCIALNTEEANAVTSNNKSIIILYGPSQIDITPKITSYSVTETDAFGPIACTADCKPNCTMTWSGPNLALGTTSILNIQNIDRNQSGNYQCTGRNEVSNMTSNSVSIVVKYGPNFVNITPLTESYTVAEQEYIGPITCTADCKPNCTLKWNGPNLPSDTTSILNIQNIDRNQSGNYQCTAINDVGSMTSVHVYISVNYGPRLVEIEPSTSLYIKNESLESLGPITCRADCQPACNITWYGPDIAYGIKDVLNLTQVKKNHAGNYSCTARNNISNRTAAVLRVFVNYAPTISKTDNNQTVSENATVIVTCTVESTPLSDVKWMFENTLLDTNETFSLSKKVNGTYVVSMLSIRRIKCLSMGLYRCIANNMLGETNRSWNVTVECSPRIQCLACLRSVIPIKNEEVLSITVPLIAFPKPTIFWKFLKNGSTENASGETVNYDNINKHSISFLKTNVTEKDLGFYRVYAYNGIGNNTDHLYSFEVISQRQPNPPGNVTCAGRINSVALSWKSEFNGGPDQNFMVYYKIISPILESQTWMVFKNYSDPGQQNYITDEIQPLQSGTSYVFKVHAVNIQNYSSSNHAFCNTSAEESDAHNQNSAFIGGLSGLGAAILILFIIGAVVYLVKSRRSQKHDKAPEPINSANTDVDSYNDELRDNPMYVSSGPKKDENKKVEYSVVSKDFVQYTNDVRDTYAVSQKRKSGNIKQSDRKSTNNTRTESKKRLIEMDCVYENSEDKIAARRNHISPKANTNNKQKHSYQPKTNKDGLVYADLDFKTVSDGMKFVIRGLENRTNYADIDLSKKADPLPDTDSDEEQTPEFQNRCHDVN